MQLLTSQLCVTILLTIFAAFYALSVQSRTNYPRLVLDSPSSIFEFYNLTLDHYEYQQKHLIRDTFQSQHLLHTTRPLQSCKHGLFAIPSNLGFTLSALYNTDTFHDDLRDLQIITQTASAYQTILISTSEELLNEYDAHLESVLELQQTMNETALQAHILETEPFLYGDLSFVANRYVRHISRVSFNFGEILTSAMGAITKIEQKIDVLVQLNEEIEQSTFKPSLEFRTLAGNTNISQGIYGSILKVLASAFRGGKEKTETSQPNTFGSRYMTCRTELRQYTEITSTIREKSLRTLRESFAKILQQSDLNLLLYKQGWWQEKQKTLIRLLCPSIYARVFRWYKES